MNKADVIEALQGMLEEANHKEDIEALTLAIDAMKESATPERKYEMEARLAGLLLCDGGKTPSLHGLVHAIPRMAKTHLLSMRASARECNCSVEWIRTMKERWERRLGIEENPIDSSVNP